MAKAAAIALCSFLVTSIKAYDPAGAFEVCYSMCESDVLAQERNALGELSRSKQRLAGITMYKGSPSAEVKDVPVDWNTYCSSFLKNALLKAEPRLKEHLIEAIGAETYGDLRDEVQG